MTFIRVKYAHAIRRDFAASHKKSSLPESPVRMTGVHE